MLFTHETALPTVHLLDPNIQNVQKERYLLEQKHNMQILGVIPFIKLQNET